MRNIFTFTLLLIVATIASADIEPKLVKTEFQLNGMQSVGNHGFICLSKANDKSSCQVTLIDLDLNEIWSVPLNYETSKKKSAPHDVEIIHDNEFIYWISKGSKVRYARLSISDGEIITPEKEIIGTEKLDNHLTEIIARNGELYVLANERGNIQIYHVEDHALSNDPVALVSSGFSDAPRQYGCLIEGNICTYAYKVDRNHSRMELNMTLHDIDGKEVSNITHVLSSASYSFGFNSNFDRSLLTFSKLENSLIAFGKLDYQFKNGYVDNPEETAFTGFWVVKINMDLSENSYGEFPFVELDQVVPAGTISRYVYIDLKEDENEDIYFNFTVQSVVFDAYTYIFHLSPMLELKHANKGKIERNFFDYNNYGVRNIARSNNITMRSDIWRYQSIVFLPMITNSSGMYSRTIEAIKQLYDANENIHKQDKIFAFHSQGKWVYIMEYTTESNGTLKFYKAER